MNSSPNNQDGNRSRRAARHRAARHRAARHRAARRRADRRRATKRMAVCAVLTAVGVVISLLGSLVGLLDLCTPLFAALLLVPIVIEYGKRYAWSVWLATALLSLFLLPNKSPAAIYLVFGYYPILKEKLERLKNHRDILTAVNIQIHVHKVSFLEEYCTLCGSIKTCQHRQKC